MVEGSFTGRSAAEVEAIMAEAADLVALDYISRLNTAHLSSLSSPHNPQEEEDDDLPSPSLSPSPSPPPPRACCLRIAGKKKEEKMVSGRRLRKLRKKMREEEAKVMKEMKEMTRRMEEASSWMGSSAAAVEEVLSDLEGGIAARVGRM